MAALSRSQSSLFYDQTKAMAAVVAGAAVVVVEEAEVGAPDLAGVVAQLPSQLGAVEAGAPVEVVGAAVGLVVPKP